MTFSKFVGFHFVYCRLLRKESDYLLHHCNVRIGGGSFIVEIYDKVLGDLSARDHFIGLKDTESLSNRISQE
jgi:hypothetical protein